MNVEGLPKLTSAEFDIMNVVWDKGKTTVGTILDVINQSREEPLRRSTIRVQVIRLEEKGWLKGEKTGSNLHYSARVPRSEATHCLIDDVRKKAFNGSCFELIKTLFKKTDVSSDEIQKIRHFINQQDKEDV
jgi:predicted transcriptional regulator